MEITKRMKAGPWLSRLLIGLSLSLASAYASATPPILRFPDGISWKALFDSGLRPKHVPGLEKTRAECKDQELNIRISGDSESLVLDSGRLSIDLLNDDRVRLLMHTSRVPISMEEGEQRLNGFRKIFAKHMVRQGSMPQMMDARRGSVMTTSDQFAVAKIGDHAFFYGFESSFQKELPLLCRFQLAWIPPPGDDTPLFRRNIVEPPAGYEWYSMDPKVHTPDPGSAAKAESASDFPAGQDGRPIGNNFDLGETANEGDFACILSFKSLGQRDLGESNCWIYLDAEIKIENLLFEKTIDSQRIEFTQRGFPKDQMQNLPEIGKKYLAVGFFNAGESLAIRKLTDPNISNIEIVEEAAIRRGIQPKNYVRAVIRNERPDLESGTWIDEKSVGNHQSPAQKGAAAHLVSHRPRWWFLGSGLAILFVAICYKVRAFRRTRT